MVGSVDMSELGINPGLNPNRENPSNYMILEPGYCSIFSAFERNIQNLAHSCQHSESFAPVFEKDHIAHAIYFFSRTS